MCVRVRVCVFVCVCVCVCPDTEMLSEHIPEPAVRAQLERAVGAGRLIEPREIAETIVFCALHPVLNGAVIHANLGQIER